MYDNWLESTKSRIKRLHEQQRRPLERLLLAYAIENGSRRNALREEIEELLSLHEQGFVLSDKPVLAIPPAQQSCSEIILGRLLQHGNLFSEFGVSREELNQHCLILGRAGHGKTTLIIQILLGLLRRNIPWIAFDFKQDLRHLIRQHPEIWVLRWEELRFNPLQPPPGMPLQRWKQIFLDCVTHSFGFFHGSRNFLLEHLDAVYEDKGTGATLQDLHERVVSSKSSERWRRAEYSDVVENRLYSITSNLGEVVNCKESMRIEELLKHPVVIELDGLGRDEQTFLVELFLFWIYAYRLTQQHRAQLRHALVFDEGKRVFDVGKEFRETTTEVGPAPIDIVTDEIRDFGEALIVADQEPSKLTHSIKANTYTKITGYLGHGKDIDDIAKAMDLTDEERSAITQLERGEWLVKIAGRYTKPFMIKTEDCPIQKNVTQDEVKQLMLPRLAQLVKEQPKIERSIPEVSEDAKAILVHVNAHPFKGVSTRYKQLGFTSKHRAYHAKEELVQKGVVKEVEVPLGKFRPVKFLVPTDSGLRLLAKLHQDTKNWHYIGRVGFEHRLYQVLIATLLKQRGYRVSLEQNVGSARVDVLAQNGDEKFAVEVELDSNVDVKSRKQSLTELSRLVIACKDSSVAQAIKSKIDCERVVVKLLNEYIAELQGNITAEKTGN